ncbi:MAG TPA: hemerythrin domain-containing protein [Flavobacterium sp.]|nr:hemerythrin domain-containing protein [Flavobacterium sp.]
MSTKPIKRHESLKPLSREHHHGLLLCWKIRQGLKKEIALERIKAYVDWFWEQHLKFHFEVEEKYIFPVLPKEHPMVLQVLVEHRNIQNLILSQDNLLHNLQTLEKELDDHIRFEERVLFNEIQNTATPAQLSAIDQHHNDVFNDTWQDEFWVTPK